MKLGDYEHIPRVDSVFHPSDLSRASESAFAHALALVLAREAELTMLHVAAEGANPWHRFPGVRSTLERWGLLEEDSEPEAVGRLNIDVRKVGLQAGHPLRAIEQYLSHNPTDLIVLATEGRDGLPAWLRPSVAERLARHNDTMTLFVPHGAGGFVSAADGKVTLKKILVPIDHDPGPEYATVYAARAAELVDETVEIALLHVGDAAKAPSVQPPRSDACTWTTIERDGDVVETIIATARDIDADLIAMTTAGRDGILDALRGSVTENVLRQAPCPVLAVPAE